MPRTFTLTIRAPGSVALGGVTGVDRTHHGASARDSLGRPYLPATALRGAIRSTLESLLRGGGEQACAGGTGLAPDAPQDQRPGPCTFGAGGQRCRACRLFGGHRDHLPDDAAFFSALILGDATTETDPAWTTRPTVGICRATRGANNHTLAMHHVPAPGGELVFTAHGRLLDPSLERPFRAALAATTHLGAGRSRGLGRVEFDLRFDHATSAPPIAIDTDELRLRIELVAPASLGVPIADDNLRDTRRELPGAALRGAIGFALSEALHGVHTRERPDSAFERLVAEDGARFGFFYPVESAESADASPLPCTALACKFKCSEHRPIDALLDAIAACLADTPVTAESVAKTGINARCNLCKGPLRSIRGPRAHPSPVKTRTITRLAMDRTRGTAKNEMLFSQVLLEPGTRFEGSIHHIPPETRARLALALQQPLSLGRGRGSGWGRIEVSKLPPLALPPLHERAAAFHRALHTRLTRAGISGETAQRWVPITLLAPLIPAPGDEDGEGSLLQKIAGTIPFKARRFVREGGWDQRAGGMQPVLAVAAGGVFAVRLPEGTAFSDVLQQFIHLEREGLGQRRHQGYGALRCFDPFHHGPRP